MDKNIDYTWYPHNLMTINNITVNPPLRLRKNTRITLQLDPEEERYVLAIEFENTNDKEQKDVCWVTFAEPIDLVQILHPGTKHIVLGYDELTADNDTRWPLQLLKAKVALLATRHAQLTIEEDVHTDEIVVILELNVGNAQYSVHTERKEHIEDFDGYITLSY